MSGYNSIEGRLTVDAYAGESFESFKSFESFESVRVLRVLKFLIVLRERFKSVWVGGRL